MFPLLELPVVEIQITELELDEWFCTNARAGLRLTVRVEEEDTRDNGDVPYILTAQHVRAYRICLLSIRERADLISSF